MSGVREFTCAACGEHFVTSLPDEFAQAEFEATYGRPFDRDKVNEVCDDCYRRFKGLPPKGSPH